jgi:hypothetical protein
VTCVGASLSEAQQAQARIAEHLAGHELVNGIGLTRVPDGWAVLVNLSQALPDSDELPDTVSGVQVHYDTIGPISKR